jgi:hypothetical protein
VEEEDRKSRTGAQLQKSWKKTQANKEKEED